VLNSDPWHGHTYSEFAKPLTAQPSCVHTAVTAVNALCAVRATRYVPVDAVTVAAPPTVAKGDDASMGGATLAVITPEASMADMKKCAHPQCKCSVISNGPFGQYCSEHCKESAAQTEIMCDCKHPACR